MDATMVSFSKTVISMKNNNQPVKIYIALLLNAYNITKQTELKFER